MFNSIVFELSIIGFFFTIKTENYYLLQFHSDKKYKIFVRNKLHDIDRVDIYAFTRNYKNVREKFYICKNI